MADTEVVDIPMGMMMDVDDEDALDQVFLNLMNDSEKGIISDEELDDVFGNIPLSNELMSPETKKTESDGVKRKSSFDDASLSVQSYSSESIDSGTQVNKNVNHLATTTTTTTTIVNTSMLHQRKVQSNRQNINHNSASDDDNYGSDSLQKKEKRKARNRELAAESRERRKLQMELLMRENAELKQRLAKYEPVLPVYTKPNQILKVHMGIEHDFVDDEVANTISQKRRRTTTTTNNSASNHANKVSNSTFGKRTPTAKLAGAATIAMTTVLCLVDSSDNRHGNSRSHYPTVAFWGIFREDGIDFQAIFTIFLALSLCMMLIMPR